MNGLMDKQTICCRDAIDATENDNFSTDYAIFTKANQRTDQWTDLPPYRDVKAASENIFANQKKSLNSGTRRNGCFQFDERSKMQVYSIFHVFCLLSCDVE